MKERTKRILVTALIVGLIGAVIYLADSRQQLEIEVAVLEYRLQNQKELVYAPVEQERPVQTAAGEGYVVLESVGPNGEQIRSYRADDENSRELWRITKEGDLVREEYYYPGGAVFLQRETDAVTGMHWEIAYSETGSTKYYRTYQPEYGSYMEESFHENGQYKWFFTASAPDGSQAVEEYNENGICIYSRYQNPEYFSESRYDADGYTTYFCVRESGRELECISNGSGKLVKVVENGIVREDRAYLSQMAKEYNFRG